MISRRKLSQRGKAWRPPTTSLTDSIRADTGTTPRRTATARPVRKTSTAPSSAPAPRGTVRSAAPSPRSPAGAAPSAAAGTPPGPAAAGPTGSAADLARETYGHMRWALDEPELGPILTKAAEEGWDENRLRGAIFGTQWFRTHGTAKVASQLKEQADAYLVPIDDQTRRNFAMKVITGEMQGAEFAEYVKGQAKSLFASNPALVAAIDRGVSVTDWAAPYRSLAAQTLEVAPESINLSDARWRRALDGSRDEKGQPSAMSLSDWERTIKQDSTYGWDRTKQARQQAAQFATSLMEKFGRI